MARYIGAVPFLKITSYSTTGSPTVSVSGNTTQLKYTASGSFSPNTASLQGIATLRDYHAIDDSTNITYFSPVVLQAKLVGGGGAGGSGSSSQIGGGGGGGAFLSTEMALQLKAKLVITVGAGGITGTTPTCGGATFISPLFATSSIFYAVAVGGGAGRGDVGANGGGGLNSTITNRSAGGAALVGVLPSITTGFAGGSGASSANSAGGGGGMASNGGAGSTTTGGVGGTGMVTTDFLSNSITVGAGGGGGGTLTGGAGGSSVGGAGGTSSAAAGAATANTGSGGGGAGINQAGTNGAAGVAYLAF